MENSKTTKIQESWEKKSTFRENATFFLVTIPDIFLFVFLRNDPLPGTARLYSLPGTAFELYERGEAGASGTP